MADKKISALTASSTPLAGTEVLPIVQGGSTVKVDVSNLTAGRPVSASGLSLTATVTGNVTPVLLARTTGNIADEQSIVWQQNDLSNLQYSSIAASVDGVDSGSLRFKTASGGTNTERMRIASTGDITASTGNLVIGTAGKGIDFSAATHAAGMTSELLNDYEEGAWTPAVGGTWTVSPTSLSGAYTKVGRQVTVLLSFTGGTKASAVSGYITGLPYATNYNGVGAVVDSDIGDRGQCLAANTDRVWLTGLTFSSGVNYATITYMV